MPRSINRARGAASRVLARARMALLKVALRKAALRKAAEEKEEAIGKSRRVGGKTASETLYHGERALRSGIA
jgi:hypothetical protein